MDGMNWPVYRLVLDDTYAAVSQAAHAGAFGANDRPLPTPGQLKTGNYSKGRATVQGIKVVIEQPEGSIRRGVDAKGKEWASRMAAHYGYFEGTTGADGDAVDVFIGPFPEAPQVFVINQNNPGGGFDEHKVMLGFADEGSARRAYLNSYERGWRGLGSIVPTTVAGLRTWLKRGNKSGPATLHNLNYDERVTMEKFYWNGATPERVSLDHVLYTARRLDGADGLLLDAVTMADILEDSDGVLALDALVVENAQLTRMAERLRTIMDRSGGEVKAPAVQVSEPFKARGVTNVAAVFELSDGQTVSVFFHNPDTSPNKLGPGDELVSWKWLLNKKDITIVVAPEKGLDLNPRIVAQRIMKLAAKNSAAFQKANTKRAERLGAIQAIRDRITEKEGVLQGLLGDIEAARQVKDEKTVSEGDKQRQFNVRSGQIVALLEASGLKWSADEGGWVKNGARVGVRSGAELGAAFLEFTIKAGAGSVSKTVADDLSAPIADTASKVLAAVDAQAEGSEEATPDPIAIVDAAYQFAHATEAFKLRVVRSVSEEFDSEFGTAKAMDMKAIELGAAIHWGVGAALDSVGDEEGDDFDPEAEFDACPVEDAALDGDFKGHPFRGNQHKKASQHSHSAVRASIGARRAEKDGDHKAAKSAHKSAHYSHLAAAESTTGKARKYHRKMAKFHGGRAGVAMDSAAFDDASDFAHGIVGKIMKGEQQMGRAVIGGDGKGMVFVGDSDDQRVVSTASGNTAAWGEDGAKMVEWLLVPAASAFKPSDKWVKVSAGEYRIDIPESTGYKGADGVTLKRKGQKWFDLGSGEAFASLADAQKMIEDWFAREERTRAEEAASRAEVEAMSKAKAQEPAAPVEVYAFKDASDEAMGLLRIGASNPAPLNAYKTAVSVEQSALAHGMAVRWEAVAEIPVMDDAGGGLFGDGGNGYIRGDLNYNSHRLASIYVRDDGLVNFDLVETMGEWVDMDEEGWTGWHDAWTDVISKLRDVCEENGIFQPAESPHGRLYEYEVTEADGGGWWANFKSDAMSELRAWSPEKDAVIAKAQQAIEMHKSSPFVARRWNSPYGGKVLDVKLVSHPTLGEGSELYEVKYPDDSKRRIRANEMERRIAEDEFNATPEGIRAAAELKEKNERDAAARKAAEDAARAEDERLNASIQEFTDAAGYSARDAGKAREVLKTRVNYAGFGVLRRMEFIAKAVEAGHVTSTEEVKKIKDKNRIQFNRMDQREQDEHEAKQKAAGTKTEYRIGKGSFFTITKTEYDYAAFLTGKRVVESAAKTPEPTVTPAPSDPKTEDRAFLMSVIDGSAPDMLEPDLAEKIEAAYSRNSGDAEMVSLFSQAVNAYTQAMLTATAGV